MKLKYYLRGVGVGILLAVLFYSTIIIPQKYKMSDDEIKEKAKQLGLVEEADVDISALTGTPSPSSEPEKQDAENTPMPTMPLAPTAPGAPSEIPEPTKDAEMNDEVPTPDATEKPEDNLTPALTPTNVPTPSPVPTPTTAPTPSPKPTPTNVPTPTSTPVPTNTPTPTSIPTPTKAAEPTKKPNNSGNEVVTLSISRGMGSESVAKNAQNVGLVDNWEEFNRFMVQNGYEDKLMIGEFRIKKGASFREIAEMISED